MRRCVSRAALVLSLVLATGAPAVLADDVPRNTRPFTRFKILLSSAFFNDTLPFDVPFILWGDVPESTDPGALPSTAVTLRIAELRGQVRDCTAVGPASYGPGMRSEARTWTATDYSDRGITPVPTDVATTTRKQFEFMVPKLKPKRVYCFLFQKEPGRTLTRSEVQSIVPKLLPAYRAFLQQTGVVRTTDDSGVEALRQALIKEVLAASPFEGLRARPNTLFDPEARPEQVFAPFRTFAVRVLGPHLNAFESLDQLNKAPTADDLANFNAWSTGPALEALRVSRPQNDPVRANIATVQSWTIEQRTRVLMGSDPSLPAEPVAEPWEPVPGYTSTGPDDPCPVTGTLSARCHQIENSVALLNSILAVAPAGPLHVGIDGTVEDLKGRKEALQDLQVAVNRRDTAMRVHLSALEASIPQSILIFTTTLGNLETRKTWYAGLDTGFAIGPTINEVFPYIGTDLYFRPINKEAPPSSFLTRFAVLMAVTWTSNLPKPGERKGLFGDTDSMLMLGAGLRATEFIRIGGGALIMKSVDPNPFVNDDRIRMTPYISLSVDIDVAGVFGRLFGAAATPPVIGAGSQPH